MGSPLSRRRFLHVSTPATISVSGCLDVVFGGDSNNIPFEVENRSTQTETLSVEFFETDGDNVLLSETIELEPGSGREYTVGPIDPQTRYTVQGEVGDQTDERILSGSGLQLVGMTIERDGSIEVYTIVT